MADKIKKLISPKTLRNKLDYTFNRYIREKDGSCIICGSTEKLQCSHYYGKRARSALRWDERNAHAMCAGCHFKHHHGAEADYALWMFQQYGMAYMKKLGKDSKKESEMNRDILFFLLSYYQEKINK